MLSQRCSKVLYLKVLCPIMIPGTVNIPPIIVFMLVVKRITGPMLIYCWPTVIDGGPTLNHHCVDISSCISLTGSPSGRQILSDRCLRWTSGRVLANPHSVSQTITMTNPHPARSTSRKTPCQMKARSRKIRPGRTKWHVLCLDVVGSPPTLWCHFNG